MVFFTGQVSSAIVVLISHLVLKQATTKAGLHS